MNLMPKNRRKSQQEDDRPYEGVELHQKLGIISLDHLKQWDSPPSIYQYSGVAPSLSRQTSLFGVVLFVVKSLGGI